MSSIEETSPAKDVSTKSESQCLEQSEATSKTAEAISQLSEQHQAYLLQRHGTLDLDPIPTMDPANPYNWPARKKIINLILVAFHGFTGAFTATSIICAYQEIAEDLGVSLQSISYLTSIQIAILGGAPLLWKTLSHRFGRRPIFLLSLLFTCVCNIGCAKSPTYSSMAVCRALAGFFVCPAIAIGTAVVMETFFKHERGRFMGVWTLLVSLGVPLGPLIFGFVAQRVEYRWIYWILAIINGVQFILYVFFGPETRYIGIDINSNISTFKREYFSFRRIDPTPLTLAEFLHPLTLFTKIPVLVAGITYSMVFLFALVMNSVEVPQLLQSKFELDSQQLGLQFLSLVIGCVFGEQLGGIMSDLWMNTRARRIKGKPEPEYRLWLSYIGFLLTIAGMVVFLVCTDQAPTGKWTVKPLIGVGIAAFGCQVVTTVMFTYAVDTYPQDAGSVGVFINFLRAGWGFIGPFWFPPMFENVGVAASSAVVAALIVSISIIPTALMHWQGRKRYVLRHSDEK